MSSLNAIRTLLRNDSLHDDGRIRSSLQSCKLSQNRSQLEFCLKTSNCESHRRNLRCLIYLLELLLSEFQDSNGRKYELSCIKFNEAYDIFISYLGQYEYSASLLRHDQSRKIQFRDLLLHPKYGLCVYLVSGQHERYILLRPDDVDISNSLRLLIDDVDMEQERIDKDLLTKLFNVLDTEWDKKVLRYVLARFFSHSKYEKLGMDRQMITKERRDVESFLEEVKMIEEKAKCDVVQSLMQQNISLSTRIAHTRRLLMEKESKWTTAQHEERKEHLSDLLSLKNKLVPLLESANSGDFNDLSTRINYARKKFIKLKRLKMRKLGSGRKSLIDSDGERFVAKAIETKATAHGRRHDSTLYLGHRVKKKDLLKLINHYQKENNLPYIKSVTTIYNRGQPKRKNSTQAKRHLGLGLWCVKKAPKSEGKDNILTHYCRAAKKNVIRSLCKEANASNVLFRSFDDKAYICPETSTGMTSARKQCVFMSSDQDLQRALPKYDFPTSMVNVTPGVVLYMNKSVTADDEGVENIVTDSRDVVVYVKPKFFVGSDASVWGSHLMEARHTNVILHEEKSESHVSITIRNTCAKILDTSRSFCFQTIKEDVLNVYGDERFKKYELDKLSFLIYNLTDARTLLQLECSDHISAMINSIDEIVDLAETLETAICNREENIWDQQEVIIAELKSLDDLISQLNLPSLKRQIIDLCDAGPGVGLTNHAVLYRVCAEIEICQLDYYARIHLAPGDSSNNEVERIQSSVGDAICDGGSLNFNYHKQYADLDEASLQAMTVSDLEKYEWERMEKNAFEVCGEINTRINGAVTIDGFMKSYVSKPYKELFFWDTEYLKLFIDTNKKENIGNQSTPGGNYYSMLADKAKSIKRAEKMLEFVRPGGIVKSVPQPLPNPGTMHYKHVDDTPSMIDGELREVDDFNPRIQLNMLIDAGFDGKCNDTIDSFCTKYIVERELVDIYLDSALSRNVMKVAKAKERENKRKDEAAKSYENYNWKEIIESNLLKKCVVPTLDKYIQKHSLIHLHGKKKTQKIEGIKMHFYKYLYKTNTDTTSKKLADDTDTDDESSGDDEVAATTRSLQTETIDDEVEVNNVDDNRWEDPSLFRTNRYGRYVGRPLLN